MRAGTVAPVAQPEGIARGAGAARARRRPPPARVRTRTPRATPAPRSIGGTLPSTSAPAAASLIVSLVRLGAGGRHDAVDGRHRRRDRTTRPSRGRAPVRRRTDAALDSTRLAGRRTAACDCRRGSRGDATATGRYTSSVVSSLARSRRPKSHLHDCRRSSAAMRRAKRRDPHSNPPPTADSTAAAPTLSTRSIGSSAYIVPISTGAASARWNQPRMAAPCASRVRASSGVMPARGVVLGLAASRSDQRVDQDVRQRDGESPPAQIAIPAPVGRAAEHELAGHEHRCRRRPRRRSRR